MAVSNITERIHALSIAWKDNRDGWPLVLRAYPDGTIGPVPIRVQHLVVCRVSIEARYRRGYARGRRSRPPYAVFATVFSAPEAMSLRWQVEQRRLAVQFDWNHAGPFSGLSAPTFAFQADLRVHLALGEGIKAACEGDEVLRDVIHHEIMRGLGTIFPCLGRCLDKNSTQPEQMVRR